jgi:hypothetical protein
MDRLERQERAERGLLAAYVLVRATPLHLFVGPRLADKVSLVEPLGHMAGQL